MARRLFEIHDEITAARSLAVASARAECPGSTAPAGEISTNKAASLTLLERLVMLPRERILHALAVLQEGVVPTPPRGLTGRGRTPSRRSSARNGAGPRMAMPS
jgi:hypothetical protein